MKILDINTELTLTQRRHYDKKEEFGVCRSVAPLTLPNFKLLPPTLASNDDVMGVAGTACLLLWREDG